MRAYEGAGPFEAAVIGACEGAGTYRRGNPAPRMKDYVAAVRACWGAYRHGYGRYEGPYYRVRRPVFQAGAEPGFEIPVYVSGVNPVMTRAAGEVADGFAAHAFTTPEYLRDVLPPALEQGAAAAGRPRPPILLYLACAPDRATAAAQMYAYTVPGYRRVVDEAGKADVADRVFALAQEGKRAEARKLVEEELIDILGVVVGDEIEDALERWRPHADRIALGVPWYGMDAPAQLEHCWKLIAHLHALGR